MNAEPIECILVEDTTTELHSAVAGVRCILDCMQMPHFVPVLEYESAGQLTFVTLGVKLEGSTERIQQVASSTLLVSACDHQQTWLEYT